MYQLLADILPYFLAFYLLDALLWVGPDDLALVRHGRYFAVQPRGVSLAALLPWSEIIVMSEPPFVVSEQTLYLHPASAPREKGLCGAADLEAAAFETLAPVQAEHTRVRLDNKKSARLSTPAAALQSLALVRRLRKPAGAERLKTLETWFRERSDVKAIQAARQKQGRLLPTQIASTALGVVAFGLLPAGLYLDHEAFSDKVPQLTLAALLLYGTVLGLSYRMLRARGLPLRQTLGLMLPLFFFPLGAVHALGVVGRSLYADFESPAVAAALAPARSLDNWAGQRAALYAVARERAAGTDRESYWALRQTWLERPLRDNIKRTLARQPTDDDARAYCPLCLAEYTADPGSCSDCDVPLRPFRATRTQTKMPGRLHAT